MPKKAEGDEDDKENEKQAAMVSCAIDMLAGNCNDFLVCWSSKDGKFNTCCSNLTWGVGASVRAADIMREADAQGLTERGEIG